MLKNNTVKIQPPGYKWLFRVVLMICFLGAAQQAQSQDMGVIALIAPVSPMCETTDQTVIVRIKNYAADTIKYAINTVVITVNVTGASTQTFKDTLNSGSLAPDAFQDVTVTFLCDLSGSGIHVFNAYTSLISDQNTINDTMAAVNITVNPLPATPTITAFGPTTFCQGDSLLLVSSSTTDNLWTGATTNDSLTVFTSGEYTVTVTSGGCSSRSDTTTVIVPATPIITTSGTTLFCQGGSVVLVSSSSTGNAWTDGSTNDSIIVSVSGSYSVTVTMSGCTNTSLATTVTVNPLPTVSLSPFSTSLCSQSAAFALTGGSPAGGIYSGIGVTAGMFYPGSAGAMQTITYTVTDSNDCSNAASGNIAVHDCTGMEEISSHEFVVYPNPGINGIFNIAIKNSRFNNLSISILDIQGKQVFNVSDTNRSADYNKQINVMHLAKGSYYIKLSMDDTDVKIQKLLIN